MPGRLAKRVVNRSAGGDPEANARPTTESVASPDCLLPAWESEETALTRALQTALDAVSQGVCLFDREGRLILCNRRFAALYGLAPDEIRSGSTLRDMSDRLAEIVTSPMSNEEYQALAASIQRQGEPQDWIVKLKDGRTIRVVLQSTPDGGWTTTHEDITQFSAARAAANERLSLQALIDRLPDNLWVKDAQSRFVISNRATAEQLGLSGPADLIGKTDLEIHPPELARRFIEDEQCVIRSGEPMIDREEYVFDASGGKTWVLTTKVPLRDENNEIFGVAGISRDITERKRADALRDGQAHILQKIALSAPLGEVLEQLVHLIEAQLKGITGSILLLEVDGIRLRHGAAPNLPKAYNEAIDGVRIGPKVGSCGTAAYRQEAVVVSDIMNDPLWEDYQDLAVAHRLRSCWSTPILSHQGAVLGTFAMYSSTVRTPTYAESQLIEVATRIAGIAIERQLAEERISFMASHDALTGLPNRTLLNDRVTQAVLYGTRYDRWVAVVFVDLDNFKIINDSLGHSAGDEVLKTVASRMVDCVRTTDTIVRLGGDEFVIVLFDQPKDADAISASVQKIQAAVAQPVRRDGHEFRVTGSFGVAIYPTDGANSEALIANADAAMYRAKDIGRDGFQFYTPEMNIEVHETFRLSSELREAVARSEFVLLYQPQIDLRTGGIFAVEALLRWNHPVQGMISPLKFIPLAEETGLIVPIGDWVLHEACRQNKAWQDSGLPPVTVCVNVSARQFKEKNLVSRVISALSASGLEGRYLELELTESLVMKDVEQAIVTMKELRSLGVQLSIDDFGTGYSSLSALKNFPVARLKIDKSFITDLTTNENDKAVAGAVISLGQKLNLRVIAEGVETDEQIQFLRENNCDEMQGYHFSRPIPAQSIEAMLLKSPPPA